MRSDPRSPGNGKLAGFSYWSHDHSQRWYCITYRKDVYCLTVDNHERIRTRNRAECFYVHNKTLNQELFSNSRMCEVCNLYTRLQEMTSRGREMPSGRLTGRTKVVCVDMPKPWSSPLLQTNMSPHRPSDRTAQTPIPLISTTSSQLPSQQQTPIRDPLRGT